MAPRDRFTRSPRFLALVCVATATVVVAGCNDDETAPDGSVPSSDAGHPDRTDGSVDGATDGALPDAPSVDDGGIGPDAHSEVTPGDPLFFDDFDYVVTDSVADGTANRTALWAAGYSRIKAMNVDTAGEGMQSSQTGGGGRLYTTDVSSIPGYSGPPPGSSSRALCINSLAGTNGAQTDFYFQVGSALGDIPANVYFQFWAYVCRSGAQQTEFHGREKFIYPTRNSYPATIGENGGHWIFELATNSSNPARVAASNPAEVFALARDGTILSAAPNWDEAYAIANSATGHLGQTDASSPLWVPNQWIETRIHYDTSGPTGVYEVWTRTSGSPWSKRVEWIGGSTIAGSSFTWDIDPAFRDGHAAIRVPTTLPGPGSTTPAHDAWIYLQDFTMAGAAEDLPTYDGH